MKKTILLLIMFFIVLSSLSLANLNDNLYAYYTLDNADLNGSNPLDKSPSANTTAITTGATTGVAGILGQAFEFDGTNDRLTPSTSNIFNYTLNITINMWVNSDDWLNKPGLSGYYDGTTDRFSLMAAGSNLRAFAGEYSDYYFQATTSSPSISDGTWYMMTLRYVANTSLEACINAVCINDTTSTLPLRNFQDVLNYTFGYGAGSYYDGTIDEIGIWLGKSLSNDELVTLYNNGTGNNSWLNVTEPDVNESVESTAVVKQVGSVTLTGTTFSTIISSDFNVSINDTELYGSYYFNVESNQNNNLFCELLIDGAVATNVSRSNVLGVLGSVYLQSGHFSLENGTHSQELRCRKTSGAGVITISNAVGIGHFMRDENNLVIPHDELLFTDTINNDSFEVMGEINFTISNRSIGGDLDVQHFLVLEWAGNYGNNDLNDQELNTVIQINDSNCSFYPRYVQSGNVGSVSGDCLIRNATTNQTYNIKVLGKGNNSNYTIDLIIKEFLLTEGEIAGGTGFPVNTSFVGLTRLFNITGGNLNHALANVFEKISFSIRANESTTAHFYVKLIDGTNFTTINFSRDVTTDVGVLIGQDILEDVPQDSYVSELWADCGTANCTIVGGDGIGYLTDITTTIFNAFNISAFDNFDNSSILEFEVTNGVIFNTTSGSLLYFTANETVNFTVTSNYNGGYFSITVLNHNASNDINVTLNQTLINFDCIEKISGNDLSCTNPTESDIFNYNVIGNPHTQSINVTSYYERLYKFNVTALQNETLNVSFYTTNLSIGVRSFNGSPISSCIFNITSYNFTFNESINGNPNSTIGLINGSYNILADCTGYAFSDVNVTIENVTQSIEIVLFTTNSINFTFYNTQSPDTLLTGVNISLDLINGGASNYSTNVGWLFVENLLITEYEARYSADNFNDNNFFFNVTNRSTQNLKLYLSPSNQTTLFKIIVKDQNDNEVVGSTVRLQQQLISQDGQFVTISECSTNDAGECFLNIEESTSINYRFIILLNGEVIRTTVPAPIITLSSDLKIITITVETGANLIEPLQQELGVLGVVTLNNNVSTYEFIDSFNAITGGCLKISRRNIPGVNFNLLSNTCVLGQSGTIQINYTSLLLNNTELKFEGIVNYTNSHIVMDTKSTSQVVQGSNRNENDLLFLTFISFMMISFAMIFVQNIYVQIIVDFAVVLGIVLLGLNLLGIPLVMTFLSLGLFIAWDRQSSRGFR